MPANVERPEIGLLSSAEANAVFHGLQITNDVRECHAAMRAMDTRIVELQDKLAAAQSQLAEMAPKAARYDEICNQNRKSGGSERKS